LKEDLERRPHVYGHTITRIRTHINILKHIHTHVLKHTDTHTHTYIPPGSEQLAGLRFPIVVLDEGSQCSEPEALIPLTKVIDLFNVRCF